MDPSRRGLLASLTLMYSKYVHVHTFVMHTSAVLCRQEQQQQQWKQQQQ